MNTLTLGKQFCSKERQAGFVSIPAQLPDCIGDGSFRQNMEMTFNIK
jgi:hypothetical protein